MERTVRYAIGALSGAALLCGIAAAVTRSAPVALAAAFVAASAGVVSLVVSYADSHQHQAVPPTARLPRSLDREAPVRVADTAPHPEAAPGPAAATLVEAPAARTAAEPQVEPAQVPAPAATCADEPAPAPEIRAPKGANPADVVEALLENARIAGDPVAAHMWLEDPPTSTLRLISAAGVARPDSTPQSIDDTVLGAAIRSGAAQLEPIQRVRTTAGESAVWRYAVPLSAGDAHGVAAVDIAATSEPDRDALTSLSAAMRGALAGALALHVARSETDVARTLLETARDLSRTLDADSVLNAAMDRAMEIAGAQTGSIMLVDQATGRMRIAVARGLPAGVVESTDLAEGEGIAGWVLASGQPLVVEDLNSRGPRSRRHGVRSAISVPLADEDGTVGVINVGSRAFQARFSRSHLDALEALGRITTIALRNAWAVRSTQDLYFDTLMALALAMETKDPYSRGGTARVVEHALALGRAMALTDSELDALHIAAMLHDIGMSAAGDVVAVSNRPLSTVEWGMLKMHPVIAGEILSQAPALREAIPIVYHHHERYDGGGYVGGLSGDQIPLGARILCVADAYVAMTSSRPYRDAMTQQQTIAELLDKSGTQFDPHIVNALVDLLGSDALDNSRQPTQ